MANIPILALYENRTLLDKLDAVLVSLDQGNCAAACGKIQAFINQVKALVPSRSLSPEQGQALIGSAEDARNKMSSAGALFEMTSQALFSILLVPSPRGIGNLSLQVNPGYLRYELAGQASGDNNALWIHRPFSGSDWSLEFKANYYLPPGKGRQLPVRLPLGGLEERGSNEIWWWRKADQYGGGCALGELGIVGFDGGLSFSTEIPATESPYYLRIIRSGQLLSVFWSIVNGLGIGEDLGNLGLPQNYVGSLSVAAGIFSRGRRRRSRTPEQCRGQIHSGSSISFEIRKAPRCTESSAARPERHHRMINARGARAGPLHDC